MRHRPPDKMKPEAENTIMWKQAVKQSVVTAASLFTWLAVTPSALAQDISHNYVNSYRSSAISHVFISQSLEGEYGSFSLESSNKTDLTGSTASSVSKWKGYNLTQTFGIEVLKFIQFNVAHSMMNMRSSNSSLERLGGSRFSGGARLVFLAPLANLEAGGGVIGTRYDYQRNLSTSDFYGSGIYYSLGFNYFMSEKVSLFGQAKTIDEHSIRNGGDSETKSISSKTTNIGAGFTLWL